eukprot:gene19549-25447_t
MESFKIKQASLEDFRIVNTLISNTGGPTLYKTTFGQFNVLSLIETSIISLIAVSNDNRNVPYAFISVNDIVSLSTEIEYESALKIIANYFPVNSMNTLFINFLVFDERTSNIQLASNELMKDLFRQLPTLEYLFWTIPQNNPSYRETRACGYIQKCTIVNGKLTDIDRVNRSIVLSDEVVLEYDLLTLCCDVEDYTSRLYPTSKGMHPLQLAKRGIFGIGSFDSDERTIQWLKNNKDNESNIVITGFRYEVLNALALHEAGLVYDGGLVVDENFRTNDPSIFAGGDFTRFSRIHGNIPRHNKYNGRDIGRLLALAVINQHIDPLLSNTLKSKNKEARRHILNELPELPKLQLPKSITYTLPGDVESDNICTIEVDYLGSIIEFICLTKVSIEERNLTSID